MCGTAGERSTLTWECHSTHTTLVYLEGHYVKSKYGLIQADRTVDKAKQATVELRQSEKSNHRATIDRIKEPH